MRDLYKSRSVLIVKAFSIIKIKFLNTEDDHCKTTHDERTQFKKLYRPIFDFYYVLEMGIVYQPKWSYKLCYLFNRRKLFRSWRKCIVLVQNILSLFYWVFLLRFDWMFKCSVFCFFFHNHCCLPTAKVVKGWIFEFSLRTMKR